MLCDYFKDKYSTVILLSWRPNFIQKGYGELLILRGEYLWWS
jgi:hypothetical protein